MGWVSRFDGQTIGVDTAIFIYYIEENPAYIAGLDELFESLRDGKLRAVTSVITVLEVLVQPLRMSNEPLASRYHDILLSSPSISTLAVTYQVAQHAAELRAHHHLTTPDALQLAVAIRAGAAAFITNDLRIPSNCGIEVLRLQDLE